MAMPNAGQLVKFGDRRFSMMTDVPLFWYWPDMKKNFTSRRSAAEATSNIAKQTRMNLNLLIKLVPWLDENEKVQHRFRNAVLIRLSNIEAMLTEIQGAQLADFWSPEKHINDKQRAKYIEEVEEQIAMASNQIGLKMVRYIYGETEQPCRPHDRRKKWSGWEI